ncbi:MAG: GH3 auxin-responsive promoter family protein [Flavobacteriaceae bacterium]|nr:GH3 auxin-responsive promoter family protein [Flavobacteriaceae bacterium]
MIKKILAKVFAALVHRKNQRWIRNPLLAQQQVFKQLIHKGLKTKFGIDHDFEIISCVDEYREKVPVRDYEDLRPYLNEVLEGGSDILWPGRPLYYAKSSGTTSGAKYIPLTTDSMPQHIRAAREALLNYIYETGSSKIINGKHIFLQGSPVLKDKKGVALGRLSGIVAHYVPAYLQKNRMPSWKTNCIEDWEKKVDAVVEETHHQNMTIIGGIPSWVQMYFERLSKKSGKTVGQLFPNFSLFVYGGVNFEPYRGVFKKLIGRTPDSIEFYPASEGFFAFQDSQKDKGLLLLLNHGIFYGFIEAKTFFDKVQTVLSLEEVHIGINYVMIISTTAGLWRYNIGDTVQFTSLNPFKIIVSGRIKQFISAFGEHVIVSEVEKSINQAIEAEEKEVLIREFTVAPQVKPKSGLPYHEWFIEFVKAPPNLEVFALRIDKAMKEKNIYYDDLVRGNILRPLLIRKVMRDGFQNYMKSIGKLGGQNKIPRVSDNRKIATALTPFLYSLSKTK